MRLSGLALVICALGACAMAPHGASSLDGTRWQVTAINGHATPRTTQYRVEIAKGRIGGRFGCNSFGGDYRVRGNVLIAGQVAATEMACPDPNMTFEGWGFSVLGQPMQMIWSDSGRLSLTNAAGSINLERAP
jgi:putative lipoprotein